MVIAARRRAGRRRLNGAKKPTSLFDNTRRYLTAILLIAAIALGGGTAPIRELVVELIALLLLVVVLARPLDFADRRVRIALVFVSLVALLPLLQLIPLPSGVWQALPGRDLPFEISSAVGVADLPHSLSLDPDATWLSWAALLPPIAMFLAALQAANDERRLLYMIIVAGALCSTLLGLIQWPGGADAFLFQWADRGLPVGLFANRNHQAAFLALGMLFAAALAAESRQSAALRVGTIACLLLLGVGAIVTRSRSGTVMMAVSALLAVLFLTRLRERRLICVAIGAGILILGAGLLLTQNLVAHQTLSRFGNIEELRPTIWRTTWEAVVHNWPVGSGFGTFVPVYQTFERLDDVAPYYINHAHCDYLELLLEGGAAAAALIIGYFPIITPKLLRPGASPLMVASALGVGYILAHSLVDYPLRMSAMATTFAMLNAFVLTPTKRRKRPEDPWESRSRDPRPQALS